MTTQQKQQQQQQQQQKPTESGESAGDLPKEDIDPGISPGVVTDGDSLNEGGKKALEAERKARREADKRAKALEAQLAAIEAANMSEQEKAIAAAKTAGATEATASMQSRLFTAEVRAAATGKLVDIDLVADEMVALKILGLESVPTTDDGQIDAGAITAAIDALVEAKPHLAMKSGGVMRPTGSPDGGPRGGEPEDLASTDMDTYRRLRRGQK